MVQIYKNISKMIAFNVKKKAFTHSNIALKAVLRDEKDLKASEYHRSLVN